MRPSTTLASLPPPPPPPPVHHRPLSSPWRLVSTRRRHLRFHPVTSCRGHCSIYRLAHADPGRPAPLSLSYPGCLVQAVLHSLICCANHPPKRPLRSALPSHAHASCDCSSLRHSPQAEYLVSFSSAEIPKPSTNLAAALPLLGVEAYDFGRQQNGTAYTPAF